MQLVNTAQFLVVTFFSLFAAAPAAVVDRTVIAALTSMDASLVSGKNLPGKKPPV